MDSSTAGSIRVVATMNTKGYDAGKKRVEKGNKELESDSVSTSQKSSSAFEKIGKVGLAAVATAAVAAGAMIVKNIGNAVSRVDTLNNFPKILMAMGVGAGEANKSTKTLAKGLKGLPTSLQDAAQGVQQFVAAGLSSDKATRAFLAMNNALIAGGADAADTKVAIDGLVRGISAGSLPASTLVATLSRMPTVFSALQKSTGKTRDELINLYQSDPQKLIDDMIRLNEVGGGGLKSLDEQARSATAGISTSFTNMNQAIVRGIASIINSVGVDRISGAIGNFGKLFENGLGAVSESVEKSIPKIEKSISSISDSFNSGDYSGLGKKIGESIGGFVKFVTVNTQSIIDWFDKINWGEVGMAVGKGGIAFAVGLITGLLSGEAISSAFGFIKDNLGAVILAAVSVIFAPSRLLSPITKLLSRLPLGKLFIRIFVTPIRSLFKPIREGFGVAFSTVFNVITSPFRRVGGVLGKLLSNIGKTITGFIENIGIRIAYLPETIVRVFTTVVRFIGRILGTMLNIIRTSLGFIGNIFSTVFNGAVTIIRTALTTGINIIRTIISGIWTVITTILRPLTAFFVNLFRAAWSQVQVVFSGVGNFFRSIFTGAINIVRTIWSTITSFFSTVWNGIVQVFSVVGNFFRTIFNDALNGIKTIWNGVTGFFSGVWNGIVNIFNGVGGWFGNVFRSAFDSIRNIFNQLGGFFRGVWNNVTRIFGDAGTKVGNAIGNSFKSVVNTVIRGAVNIINGFIKSINSATGTINRIPGVNIGKIRELGIPQLANGGIIKATPGGILANIGEGGQDEAVIPLSKLDALLDNNSKSGSGKGDVFNITVQGTFATSKAEQRRVAETIAKRIQEVKNSKTTIQVTT